MFAVDQVKAKSLALQLALVVPTLKWKNKRWGYYPLKYSVKEQTFCHSSTVQTLRAKFNALNANKSFRAPNFSTFPHSSTCQHHTRHSTVFKREFQ